MALDILVSDLSDKVEKSVSLYLEEYNSIMERIENNNDFALVRKAISNYYGEYEIYLNELDKLNKEALHLKDSFKHSHSQNLKEFIEEFLDIIDYALKHHRTIKFIGD